MQCAHVCHASRRGRGARCGNRVPAGSGQEYCDRAKHQLLHDSRRLARERTEAVREAARLRRENARLRREMQVVMRVARGLEEEVSSYSPEEEVHAPAREIHQDQEKGRRQAERLVLRLRAGP